jgi:hypothetical protein
MLALAVLTFSVRGWVSGRYLNVWPRVHGVVFLFGCAAGAAAAAVDPTASVRTLAVMSTLSVRWWEERMDSLLDLAHRFDPAPADLDLFLRATPNQQRQSRNAVDIDHAV